MPPLPRQFIDWFSDRGWAPHAHQLAMLQAAQDGTHALLIAPTGGGKTLAGFLPSMVDAWSQGHVGLHTLYVSPLKALAVDVHRNLEQPLTDMGLGLTVETRTGDTPQGKKRRQRERPPNFLLTTPESLSLLLSFPDARDVFETLKTVVVDEIHALAGTKRGDQMALCLARLGGLAPRCRYVGLSATVPWPQALRAWLAPGGRPEDVALIEGDAGIQPQIRILTTQERMPWSGHMGLHAMAEVYNEIAGAETTIVFVNTRAQAELIFQALWHLNDKALPIALHHGSLEREQRRKVEAAMARGDLRAVVATSSLDLGIDWGAVDLVIQIGAPKGVSRLIQRIGRAGHRLDTPSRAILVPANRFEVLECRAALDGVREMTLDGDPPHPGGLDVLAQHIMCVACAGPFEADDLFDEVRSCAPYADLTRADFDDTLRFVENGGYALRAYDRWHRLTRLRDGRYEVANARIAQRYRMNVGTIVEAITLKVRIKRGRFLGEVEEYFAMSLETGDTFMFSGQLLRFEGIRDMTVEATPAAGFEPKVPAFQGGRLPLTTHLADRVRQMLADNDCWHWLPDQVSEWLRLQEWRSVLPDREGLLVETFPRGGKQYMVAYCFEGRNAHQTLGMLLTRRMERAGLGPLGFVATDYVLAIWSLRCPRGMAALFDEDMLGDDLEAWMDESSMLRRTFRNVAVIAGLIERRHPGQQKTGRQVTFSSDLVYDVLRQHEPEHVLLRATRADAARGLTDIGRVGAMLHRVKGRIAHRDLDRVSPLAVPILLEVGREQVYGAGMDDLLTEAADALIEEATRPPEPARLPL